MSTQKAQIDKANTPQKITPTPTPIVDGFESQAETDLFQPRGISLAGESGDTSDPSQTTVVQRAASNIRQLPQQGDRRQQAMLRVQQHLGNAAAQRVISILKGSPANANALQRTPIGGSENKWHERLTLDQQPATPGGVVPATSYTTGDFTGTEAYELARQAARVLVTVRVLFLAPPSAASPQGSEITDAHLLQQGRDMCRDMTTLWNGKYELVGHPIAPAAPSGAAPHAPTDAGTVPPTVTPPAPTDAGTVPPTAPPPAVDIVLPLAFESIPVYVRTETHHQQVFLHGDATPASGSTVDPSRTVGQPAGTPARFNVIDAGNFYTSITPGEYGQRPLTPSTIVETPVSAIYAHEYGHFLGIPDEYSRTNPAMHTILHGVTPDIAERQHMDAQLNEQVSRTIILEAMRGPLTARVRAVSGQIATAMMEQHRILERQLATAVRNAWQNSATIDGLIAQMQPELAGQDQALAQLAEVVRFEAARNMSNITIAQQQVASVLDPARIAGIMNGALITAIDGRNPGRSGAIINTITGQISMRVETRGIDGPNADPALQPLRAAASTASSAVVGSISAPLPAGQQHGTTPPISPSAGLADQLAALPAQWRTLGTLFNPTTLSGDILAGAPAVLAGRGAAVGNDSHNLYTQLYQAFQIIAANSAQNTLGQFLSQQVGGLIDQQLSRVQALIAAEPDNHSTATPSGTDATGTGSPDPAIQARAIAIQAAMRPVIDQARAVRDTPETTTQPSTTGGPATEVVNDQHVSLTVNSEMGSNHPGFGGSIGVRPDFMSGVARQFNNLTPGSAATDLRHNALESEFTVRMAGSGGSGGAGTGTTAP